MEARKIDIIDAGNSGGSTVDTPRLNGANYFKGDVIPGPRILPTKIMMTIDDAAGWREAWKITGHAPPGNFPQGAAAVFQMFFNLEERPDVSLVQVDQADHEASLTWNVTYTPMDEAGKYGTFAFILLPPQLKISQKYDHKTLPTDAEQRAAALAAELRDFSPALKRNLPAPRPLQIKGPL